MDIRGDLETSVLVDVIALLASIKTTGTLTLEGKSIVDIHFREGNIIGGASNSSNDFIDQIISLETGNYYFSGTASPTREYNFRLTESHDSFVYKIVKKSKGEDVCSDVYHDDMVFKMSDIIKLDELELGSEEWRVLALLSEQKSMLELRTSLSLDLESAAHILFGLEQVQIIRRVRREKTVNIGASLIKKIRNFLERFSASER